MSPGLGWAGLGAEGSVTGSDSPVFCFSDVVVTLKENVERLNFA